MEYNYEYPNTGKTIKLAIVGSGIPINLETMCVHRWIDAYYTVPKEEYPNSAYSQRVIVCTRQQFILLGVYHYEEYLWRVGTEHDSRIIVDAAYWMYIPQLPAIQYPVRDR